MASNLDPEFIDLTNRINELEIQNEALDQTVAEFLEENQVTAEQLTLFLSNPAHFTADNWEQLTNEKKKLNNQLERTLKNIVDPRKKKKAFQDLQIPNHWLYVR